MVTYHRWRSAPSTDALHRQQSSSVRLHRTFWRRIRCLLSGLVAAKLLQKSAGLVRSHVGRDRFPIAVFTFLFSKTLIVMIITDHNHVTHLKHRSVT